ncbi:MAG: aromatic ring-hydroxylating dioxygenase subunit alpha [Actinomycetota bacterium]|nr:aromatic ring-hydroxylating dioxygenase subunit alpha [Actinomycetota bacterium]
MPAESARDGALAAALADGWTLPADWYSDPGVWALEKERIFRRAWQYAGHLGEVERPGDFFTCLAGHVPVVVTRDEGGELRAFVNVCRHRAHVVAEGAGHRASLQCPYHAWTYGLDGALRAAPRSDREPGFDRSRFSLLPVQVDVWGPFVFVNADLQAPPLAEFLGDLPALVERSGLEIESLAFRMRNEFEIAANWKVVVENFLECYHCPVAHPSFSELIDVDPDAYRLEARGWCSSQIAPVRPRALERPEEVAYDPRGEVTESQFHYVWPTFTLNVVPGPPNATVFVIAPAGAGRTRTRSDYFFPPDVDEERVGEIAAFGSVVGQEDSALVESVQRGLDSGLVPQGRLLVSSEHLIQHFQGLVHSALAEAGP